MEDDVDLIQSILPNVNVNDIIRVLEETGDIGSAVQKLTQMHPNSPAMKRKRSKRIIVSVHNGCGQIVFDGINEATNSIRSIDIESSEFAPQYTISVSFQDKPCKPMIYIEPKPFDMQFCSNIEPHSIVLSENYDDLSAKVNCSLFSIVLLALTKENVAVALRSVFIENGIVGDGYGTKLYGDIWKEMLRIIPMISVTYADVIANAIPTPFMAANSEKVTNLTSRSGNKVPQRVLETVKTFYTAENPDERLETGPRRRNIPA